MKKLLPILLCYVLMTSQVFAISGGPVYGGSSINPVGVYSGVITVNTVKDFINDPITGAPILDPNTGQAEFTIDQSTVSLGLFSLAVPTISVAQGAFIQFVNGDVFVGEIVASVNPDSGALSGIVEGTSNYSVNLNSGTTVIVDLITNSAAGKITAQVGGTRQGSLSSATLNGTANLIVNSGGNRVTGNSGQQGALVENYALDCTVSGFRQSATYSAVTTLGLSASGT